MSVEMRRRPVSPGRVLREDYIEPLGLKQEDVARALGVHRTTINEVLNGRRAITPDMALRLSHVFSTTPEYWLRLQQNVDLYDAVHSDTSKEIEKLPVLA